MFSKTAIVAALAFVASASAASHTVIVGDKNGDTIYTPPYLNAAKGDNVIFQFEQKNHSAVQSTFDNPCTSNGGFNSGFHPVGANVTSNFPTFTIPVHDTKPIWVYCAQNAGLPTSHCGMGMVFAVNPAGKFDAFKQKALAIGAALKAGSSTSSAPPTQTSSAAGVQHTIVVGDANGDTIYTPPYLNANPGDELIFQFEQKNHSAVQSTFDNPCTSNGGFNSGFHPVAPGVTSNFPTFTVPVKDKNPIWVYCAQNANLPTSHCGMGMVFAANPGALFGAFKAKALAIGTELKAHAAASSAIASATARIGTITSVNPPPAATHTVVVGDANGDTIYTPPYLDANPGDKVLFQFEQKNHSVVSSTFDNPCTANGVFNSGFFPVAAGVTSNFPTFEITIKDKNPVWAYCAQNAGLPTSHCGMGMVWAANPGNKFGAFKAKALAIGAALKAADVTTTMTTTTTAKPTTVFKTFNSFHTPSPK
ncbi:hypothetical protein EIP91_000649 [Steccherinum ochraceum]|uniref:Phytocyanin domain-containing protein n=1 Tax=Steccherinum ochraceum TaxID=92696 RepID=A0A4R0RP02_9APHY|nr:hypothetical protein EIP91_000649 [Steccherinum ochraceum]